MPAFAIFLFRIFLPFIFLGVTIHGVLQLIVFSIRELLQAMRDPYKWYHTTKLSHSLEPETRLSLPLLTGKVQKKVLRS